MSKRELETLASVVDVDAPRAKRRKEVSTPAEDEKLQAGDAAAVTKKEADEQQVAVEPAKVQEQALKLWQTVKDAVDKDGRNLSFNFIRLPSKRQYPDYYEQIKKPIALDQIKAQIEAGEYATLFDVKHDLETCFRNAKRYNQKESQIWLDAKALHKVIGKEYAQITGRKGEVDANDEDGEEGATKAGSGEEKKKKSPNLTRALTARLEKLVAQTDDEGGLLSTHFMELPSKKHWAIYYKTITKPMSFEKIFKHLKRKEYPNATQFAADVELVFSNAMQFNEDHTPIWEAARALKEHFAKLMADLPAPFAIPPYSTAKEAPRASNGKIKFKMPAHSSLQPAASTSTANTLSAPAASTNAASPRQTSHPLILKVPLGHAVHSHAASSSAQASSASPPVPTITSSLPTLQPAGPAVAPIAAQPQHAASTSTPTATSSNYSASHQLTQAAVQTSPTPSQPSTPHPLKSLSLVVAPVGRRLELDHRDGVRSWALRLGPGERALRIANVQYHGEEEEESSGGEEAEEEEEEEDQDMEESKSAKGKGKEATASKGRKRRGGVRIKDGVKLPPKRAPPQIIVRLDKAELKASLEDEDEWDVELPTGAHLLELGEKGGPVWKVYVQKTGL